MTFERKRLGASGEELAAQFLLKEGYRILARNLKTKYGEVDILALDGSVTVVVEVKTKSSLAYGRPVEMVGRLKQQKLRLLATYLASQHNMVEYRIDIIAIDWQNKQAPFIEHYKSAI